MRRATLSGYVHAGRDCDRPPRESVGLGTDVAVDAVQRRKARPLGAPYCACRLLTAVSLWAAQACSVADERGDAGDDQE